MNVNNSQSVLFFKRCGRWLIKPHILAQFSCLLLLGTLCSSAQGGVTYTPLASFTANESDTGDAMVQGIDGNLYGTTVGGGTNGSGSVFKLSSGGTLAILYSFGPSQRGPNRLLAGQDGMLYGTTTGQYGSPDHGTIFKISTEGLLTTLYSFTNGSDGNYPSGGLMQGADGGLYGCTWAESDGHLGTIFRVTTNGLLTTVHAFGGFGSPLGASPVGELVQDSVGNLYGVTQIGGTNLAGSDNNQGYGTVFQMTTNGVLNWSVSFNGINGYYPWAGLVQANDGNLYGTTFWGGQSMTNDPNAGPGYGTLFKVTTNGILTPLYSFTARSDGGYPSSALVVGNDGNLYGVDTQSVPNTYGYGTFFRMTPDGTFTSLYALQGATDGAAPFGGLMLARDGNFYGTTSQAGAFGAGTVYRLSVPVAPTVKLITQTNGIQSLSWTAAAGQTYQLQSTTNLASTNWNNEGTPIVADDGTVTTTNATGNDGRRFYRVEILP